LRVVRQGPSTDAEDWALERGSSGGSNPSSVGSTDGPDWKEIVTLQVPLIKPRSSSLDVSYYSTTLRVSGGFNGPGSNGSGGIGGNADDADDRRCSCENLLLVDSVAKQRSTSVDVSLPTDASGGTYRAITHYDHHQQGK